MAEPTPPQWYLLDRMVDVAPPAQVSWWPQTAGWKALGLALMVVLALWLYHRIRLFRFNRYRREALHALLQLEQNGGLGTDSLFRVLKAVAVHVEPALAPRLDATLLAYLDHSARLDAAFDSAQGQRWLDALLNPAAPLSHTELQHLCHLTRHWIRRHRNPRQPAFSLRRTP
ncbi:hypothetical protein GCM10011348_12000 [Marinobacterium nitratireducens]|uniref:DUF4381 domain-containing protein n=1 Tax=Marinobacterium nitratireducens TaxID=518897 RepID=A0A917ZAW4_9GAMM|nr:DUF4381 domain-containing protein [Marinobacterium nitratireducens]GGO78939.1 hypothetical protein GCM10011348_12000 [Marinobacterium nitratireducens]